MTFMLLGGSTGYLAMENGHALVVALLVYLSMSLVLVGIAYAFAKPEMLLKAATGQQRFPSLLLFFPYRVLSFLSLALYRIPSKEEAFTSLSDSLVLGRIPFQTDQEVLQALGIESVLDLTAEYAAAPFVRDLRYRNLALLDGTAPSQSQLETAVSWIKESSRSGAVLVHCALGHGRSATVAAAYLASRNTGLASSEALRRIKLARPGIGLNRDQQKALEEFVRTQEKR